MTSSFFRLAGSYSTVPSVGAAKDSKFEISGLFDEGLILARKHVAELSLTTDGPVSIGLGGLSNVHVVIVAVPGGTVTLRLTSTAGTTQAIPVGGWLSLVSRTIAFTAIDVAREPGILTTVKVFLGERV